ncbi:MAG: M48 family metallopeptidase [Aeromonas sp.]
MKRILLLIALVAGIPVSGYLAGIYVEGDFQKQWSKVIAQEFGDKGITALESGQLSLERFCAEPEAATESACQTYSHVQLLQDGSILAFIGGLGLLLAIFLSARIVSSNRSLLLAVFSPGIKAVLLALFGLVLVQGAIATYGAYIFESITIHRVHFVLIGGIGLTAFYGAISMIKAGFSISKRASTSILGKSVSEEDEPQLWKLVKETAVRLGATPPKSIVIGLEPNFYVTSADVIVYPGANKQPNETLYLSLPLMRILSLDELTAVIGHELGHFRGEDTKFSLQFYPIYAGTGQALSALKGRSKDGANILALLPAFAILSFFMEQFAQAERTIGRSRELEADKAGASVSSARALAKSLLKIGAFAPLWRSIRAAIVEALNQGKAYTNVSSLYAEAAASSGKPEFLDEIAATATTHPTDSHPPTGVRIQAMGLSVAELNQDALTIDENDSSANLLVNLTAIEEELTDVEHRYLLELGAAKLPKQVKSGHPPFRPPF